MHVPGCFGPWAISGSPILSPGRQFQFLQSQMSAIRKLIACVKGLLPLINCESPMVLTCILYGFILFSQDVLDGNTLKVSELIEIFVGILISIMLTSDQINQYIMLDHSSDPRNY